MEPKAQKLKDFIENAGYNAYIAPDETVYCDALYLMGIKIDENGQYINKLSPEEKFNSPQEVLQELIIRSKDKAKRTYNYFSEHACSTNISLEKNIDFDYNIEKIILETNNNISKRQEIYKNILRLEYAIAIARIDKK